MFHFVRCSRLTGNTVTTDRYLCSPKIRDVFIHCKRRVQHTAQWSSSQNPATHFTVSAPVRIWRQAQKVLRLASRQQPRQSNISLKFILGPAALTVTARLLSSGARCHVDVNNNVPAEVKEKTPEFSWSVLWVFVRPELLALIGAIILAFAAAVLNIQIPMMLGDLVNVVARHMREQAGHYMRDIRTPAVKLLGLYALQGMLTSGYIILLSRVGERVAANMRKTLFSSLLRQDVAFFDANKTGQLVNRLTSDIQEFKSSFKLVISQGLRSTTQTVGCFFSLYIISPKLTGLTVVVLPCLVGAGALIGSFLRNLSRKAQEQVAKATGVADEALGNVRTVRAFAMEDRELEMYAAEVEKSAEMNETLGTGIAVFQGLSNIVLNCIVLGTIFAGGSLMAHNDMSPGDLMSFLVASQTVQRSLASISILFGQMVRGMSAGARVFEYLTLEPTIPLTGGGRIPHRSLTGRVDFMNIYFSYPTRPGSQVLKNFSLTLPPCRTVAIVGESGGGKSTVAALLERFYDPIGGVVMLDGLDIRTLDPSWLRGHVIGFISQEPVLFGTSVMENIRFGKPSATDVEVVAAAKQANAHNFITGFSDGYNTVVGERGVTLSGGQKQRIAIARALIKNPSILILDEATSALDAESEHVVQEALDRATSGRTVLIIAHRLSTIQGADLICVISNGRIVEAGTHLELLSKGGLYAELIKRQRSEK
ncbi:mitochondrial potassium channel ATP-binding subunit isoform X1 [Triplophysa rosa]|uniref:Mitochondrial potassium channel ATP-binding subunit n=1 Tax=Triplophysa rosa TaxID=992332 RepID=A0A9W7WB67_TRIRA|nr:mitochondrial potassium channel ATP-binding subunit isoform X1 [Triplophysa rosa]KAI7792394.1 ATP-binding cassette sub-family B member 8 [Triplophysa rosa]